MAGFTDSLLSIGLFQITYGGLLYFSKIQPTIESLIIGGTIATILSIVLKFAFSEDSV